jgi:subtilisin family serine protease
MHRIARTPRIAIVLSVVAACMSVAAPAGSTPSDQATDRLLVKFRSSAKAAEIGSAMKAARATEVSQIHDLGVRIVKVSPARLDTVLATFRRSPYVLFAEYDGTVHVADTVPNDPSWPNESSAVRIRAPQAWDYSTGSPGVTIAVLDTGVDPSTPDLQGAFVPGYDFVNNDADPSDDHGHGTLAAGVAAARGNNGLGIAGYCWSCSIMPVKVIGADGSGLQSTLASGITWAADHGARVISMSVYGGAYSTLASAVKYARSKGVVLVAAAGNSGSSGQTYPAAYPEVLGAAGANPDDTLNSNSNYGSWVKLAAPWCNYGTSMRQADGSYRYASFCGTSSATPAIAGIAALAFSYLPTASATSIEQALESSSVPVIAARQVAYGRIDALATMLALGAMPPPPPGSPPVNATAPAIAGAPAEGQTLTASAGTWAGSSPMSLGYQWQRCDSSGSACAALPGAIASTYVLGSNDVGSTIRVVETATNGYGFSSATSSATARIAAAPSPPPPSPPTAPTTTTVTFTGSLNKKQGSKGFNVKAGAGQATASLEFTKSASLALTVLAADGSTIGSASGPSIVKLVKMLPAGTYQYVVAGTGNSATFTLTVAYSTPE